MAKNYASIAFSDAAKEAQAIFGSRSAYERVEKNSLYEGLTEQEKDFISERDSFYMASVGSNGFPYIQHRGGPKGFVRILDKDTLALFDFRGNKQYVTIGNLATNAKVALFFMDYPNKTRLKIYATAQTVALGMDEVLENNLALDGYSAKPERILRLTIEAFDWNCPQHITPRYTIDEIQTALAPQKAYMEQLEKEIERLKTLVGVV